MQCFVELCAGHGMFVQGADVNAGIAIGTDVQGVGGWGVWDDSFLWNTHIQHEVADALLGAYKATDATSHCTFLGMYAEGGQPHSQISGPTTVFGGIHNNGWTNDSQGLRLVDHLNNNPFRITSFATVTEWAASTTYAVNNLVQPTEGHTNGYYYKVTVGSGSSGGSEPTWPTTAGATVTDGPLTWTNQGPNQTFAYLGWPGTTIPTAFGFQASDDTSPLTLEYGKGGAGWWGLTWAHGDGYVSIAFSTPKASVGAGHVFFPNGFYFWGGYQRYWSAANAAPTGGTYANGDMVWNLTTSAGSPIGWTCTVAGTPGTWKSFGIVTDKFTATTSNNSTTTVKAIALSDNATSQIDVLVTAKQTAGTSNPDGAAFSLRGAWYRDSGGAPVQVKGPTVMDSNPNANGAAWTAVLAVSGNNVNVNVTGDTGKTIAWTCVQQVQDGR